MEKGLRLCRERRQRPYLAQGYFEYAHILLKRKDKKQSKNYLNDEIKIFTEMKMIWWLEQAKDLEKSLS